MSGFMCPQDLCFRVVGCWNGIYLFSRIFGGGFKCKRWSGHLKKFLLVYIWCMLDRILSQNCRNTLPLHAVDQLSEGCKNLDVVVPNQLLAVNVDAVAYQMEEYNNPGFVVILHCLNSFQHSNYCIFTSICI